MENGTKISAGNNKTAVLLFGLTLLIGTFLAHPALSVPVVGTVTPNSGSSHYNTAVTFTTTYDDQDGWQDITYIYFLINKTINGKNGFYAQYDRANNLLYLRDDNNTQWLGGYAPGSNNIIENSYAILDCSNTSVSGLSTEITADWNVTFKNTFTGAKNTCLAARDTANAFSAWHMAGTWTINYNAPPAIGTITPSSGSSHFNTAVSFTTTYTDQNGWQDITYIYFLVNKTINGKNGLYARYDRQNDRLYLRNDDNTQWLGGYAPGSSNSIENFYAKLDCNNTSVSGTDSKITAVWNVTFKSTFKGAKNTCLAVRDTANAFSAWQMAGTWTINYNARPAIGTITPGYGNSVPGTAVTFTTTYNDQNGYQDIAYIYFLINKTINGKNGFYAHYDYNNDKLYLRDDDNTQWLGGYAPGSSNIIENSYAKLDCSKTSVSGSDTTITAVWNVTFKSTFKGAKNTCLAVRDIANAFSAWHMAGTWTIDNVYVFSRSGDQNFPRYSPDGTKIVYSSRESGNWDIWIRNTDGTGTPLQVTTHTLDDFEPNWSPDGKKIIFRSRRDKPPSNYGWLYTKNSDGTGAVTKVSYNSNLNDHNSPDWSPDGTKIAYSYWHASAGFWTIYISDPDASSLPYDIIGNATFFPSWSPDGKYILYSQHYFPYYICKKIVDGNGDGIPDSLGAETKITTDDGLGGWSCPRWSPDDSKIVYRSKKNGYDNIWVMDADGKNSKQLTSNQTNAIYYYPDWSPDGSKISYASNCSGDWDIYIINYKGIGDPSAAPLALITSHIYDEKVKGNVTITGTAADNISVDGTTVLSQLQSYTLAYQEEGDTTWTTIITGTTPVTNGTLGTWNTGSLNKGAHYIRLSATDGTDSATVKKRLIVE